MKLSYLGALYVLVMVVNAHAFDGGLRGKTCLITGATSGIGKETAFEFAARGCKVIVAARNEEAFLSMAKQEHVHAKNLSYLPLDLSSIKSVTSCADNIFLNNIKIDIVVNNAGAFLNELKTTADNLETMFQVNYLSPFLLTELLMSHGVIKEDATIVNIVSDRLEVFSLESTDFSSFDAGVDWSGFLPGITAYARSKLMLLMYTFRLAREASQKHPLMTVLAYHPGDVRTKHYDQQPFVIAKMTRLFMRSPEKVSEEIYALIAHKRPVPKNAKDILVGTKLGSSHRRFAVSEINQDHLYEESHKLLLQHGIELKIIDL